MIQIDSLNFLILGLFLGLMAGISPGPLLTLLVTETLRHRKIEGIKMAFAPLITDLPIIIISSYCFYKFSEIKILLGLVSLIGGIYLGYLGYKTINTNESSIQTQNIKPTSLKMGIIANFLSPHPYFIMRPKNWTAIRLKIKCINLHFI